MSDTASPLSLVGDIVERNVSAGPSAASAPGLSGVESDCSPAGTTWAPDHNPPLRPIQAVVGQAFPAVQPRRRYGRRLGTSTSAASTTANLTTNADTPTQPTQCAAADAFASTAEGPASSLRQPQPRRFTGLSAHVQPQDAHADPYSGPAAAAAAPWSMHPGLRGGGREGVAEPVQAAGGSAQQRLPAHQWSAAEFHELQRGFYAVKIDTAVAPAAASSTPTAAPLTGEDFFARLFQCLRSTVRRHQQLALEVLLAHLAGLLAPRVTSLEGARREAAALRDRCVHGPNCGPFLFFVLEVLASAGHPAMIELAATCLLLLLRGVTRGEEVSSHGGGGGVAAAAAVGATASGSPYGEESRVALLVEAIAELGSPPGDSPGDAETEDGASGTHAERTRTGDDDVPHDDDPELPFSAVSELLRGADARLGLEQLGFTNKVLAAMQLLLFPAAGAPVHSDGAAAETADGPAGQADRSRHHHNHARGGPRRATLPASPHSRHAEVLFLELLLCGGLGVNRRPTCRRIAEDPPFAAWVAAQLSAVVVGQRPLADLAELLCVLQHLAHVPAALRALLRGTARATDVPAASGARGGTGGAAVVAAPSLPRPPHPPYETWLLFFLLVCSTSPTEVRTARHAAALVWCMLFLRACARLGPTGAAPGGGGQALLQDLSDTLLAEGLQLGGGVVLEMWFLRYAAASDASAAAGRLDSYFLDVARAALQACRTPATDPPRSAEAGDADGAAVAQRMMRDLRWTTCAHFLATFVVHTRHHHHHHHRRLGQGGGAAVAQCYTLAGTATATMEAMAQLVRGIVGDTTRVAAAFARLTTPLLSASWHANMMRTPATATQGHRGMVSSVDASPAPTAGGAVVGGGDAGSGSAELDVVTALRAMLARWVGEGWPAHATSNAGAAVAAHDGGDAASTPSTPESGAHTSTVAFTSAARCEMRDRALVKLAMDAAALHASTRLAAAVADVYPAVARDVTCGFAAMLVHAFEEACLRLRDAAPARLPVDELCTVAAAVQLLQRGGDTAPSSPPTPQPCAADPAAVDRSPHSTPGNVTSPVSRYTREARVGAFFLLHSIAISKHCLDVVPTLLPLLVLVSSAQPDRRAGERAGSAATNSAGGPAPADTAAAANREALLESLCLGIEVTPVPVMVRGVSCEATSASSSSSAQVSVSGAPRSWVLYPLMDSAFGAKHVWAGWLRRLLGLHQRIKDVLGWDAVLSHVLLWTLAHRRELWGAVVGGGDAALASASRGVTTPSSPSDENLEPVCGATTSDALAVVDLMEDLCSILHAPSTTATTAANADAGGTMSPAASRTLEISLAAYSDAPSEEGLPLRVHAVLAYVAAHSTARAALAAVQVLLLTPVLPASDSHADSPCAPRSKAGTGAAVDTVCAWLATWSAAPAVGPRASWSLDDIVTLVQLVGPHFAVGGGGDGEVDPMECVAGGQEPLWCARLLTRGCLRCYVRQRLAASGALSRMEKAVLRSTLEELDYFPDVLWAHVCDG